MPDTTIPASDLIGDWSGPPDALLAHLTGSWSALKPKARMTLSRIAEPAPSAMRLGVCVGGVGPSERDGCPWTNRLASLIVHAVPEIPRNPNGWPVPTGAQIAYMLTDEGGRPTPPGEYELFYSGRGDVRLSDRTATGPQPAGVPLTSESKVTIKPGHIGGVQVEIRNSDPSDPVCNVSLAQVGHGPFTPDPAWTEPLRGRAKVIRPLGWTTLESGMKYDANGNYVPRDVRLTAANVPTHYRAQQCFDADPWLAASLAENIGADSWHCVIDGAEDGYYRAYAFDLTLGSGTRIIEYSNEVWNNRFDQYHRILRRAQKAGISVARQYAREALACLRIFKAVLGDRFRGVLGCHLANSGVAAEILNEALKAPDFRELVHAIAPSGYWYPTIEPPAQATVAQLVADCARQIDTRLRRELTEHKALADAYGVATWLYELGPHEPNGRQGDALYQPYMHSQEIAVNYRQALKVYAECGVSLATHMGYVGQPGASWFLVNKLGDASGPRWDAFWGGGQ